ncbi:MAG: hypothetical protein WBG18_25305 [Xanthobacteraceae bacterium]
MNNYHQLQKPSAKCGQWQTSRTTKEDEQCLQGRRQYWLAKFLQFSKPPLAKFVRNFDIVFDHVVDLGARLQQIWRNYRGLCESFLIHIVTVFFGAIEVYRA